MRGEGGFYTFRGYSLMDLKRTDALSPSMEDYLEMLYRLCRGSGYTRLLELAEALHVQPPSASRMVQKLSEDGFVQYEKYGVIKLTEQGLARGRDLIERHEMLMRFFAFLGVSSPLEDTEKVEHSLSEDAISGMKKLLDFVSRHPEIAGVWREYLKPAARMSKENEDQGQSR